MKNKHAISLRIPIVLSMLLLMFITGIVSAQTVQPTIFEDWATAAGTQHFFQKSVTKTDANDNVYIAGATTNSSGNYDVLVAKYSKTGVLSWINQYDGNAGGNDFATAMTLDDSGNVYITGSSLENISDSNDIVTIKYNNAGAQQWIATSHGGYGTDGGSDIVVDHLGSVYICGTSLIGGQMYDIVTLKYDNSGTQIWSAYYDYSSMSDAGYKITINGSDVVIGVGVQTTAVDFRPGVLEYDTATGTLQNSSFSTSAGIGFSIVSGIFTDAQKNIYMTGSKSGVGTGLDYYTVMYDSTLTQIWTASYNGSANSTDESKAIVVDGSGNVYITGYATTSAQGRNFVTIKYNSGGTQQWVQSVNDQYNGHDEGAALALDNADQPIVTGHVWNGITNDYYTIKYDASGSTIWSISWNSVKDENDRAFDIAVDTDGNIIVVGQSGTGSSLNYSTVKYSQHDAVYMPDGMTLSSVWSFVQNRGQVLGTDNTHLDTLKYYSAETHPKTYFSDKTLSYVFTKRRDTITDPDSLARVDMRFKNSNPDRVIRAFDKRKDFFNFYGAGTPEGAVKVPLNKRLVSYDVYSKTDVEYVHNGNGLATYFYIRQGGNPASIQMTYSGQNGINVNGGGDLVISTAIGTMTMPKAFAFQIDNSGNYVSLNWQPTYSITGSTVSFTNLGAYNSSYVLVFRMDFGPYTGPSTNANGNMWWSTYYGNPDEDDFSLDVCNDNKGNTYVVGYTWDQSFPVTNLIQWAGGSTDGVVLKFDDQAEREWATFYGGNHGTIGGGFDYIRSAVFNSGVNSGHLYITGQTNSESRTAFGSNFPIIPSINPNDGSYWQNTNYGTLEFDAFIARMDTTNGNILWSQFFGGRDLEDGISIKTASNGRVFIIGNTRSVLGDSTTCNHPNSGVFPLCHSFPSAYFNPTFNGGTQDCFISFFDTTNTLRWSTYLGSNGYDDAYDAIYNDLNNSIYMVGATDGNFLNHYQPGEYHMGNYLNQTTQKGFVTRFGNGGALEWSTPINRVSSMQTVTNINKQILIAGITNAYQPSIMTNQDTSAGYSICGSGYMDSTITGNADYYLMSFNDANVLRWSTFIGGGTDESAPYAVGIWNEKKFLDATADTSGNVYVVGATDNWGTPAFTTLNQSPFFWQPGFAGGDNGSSDMVLFCFRANRTLAWSSYCGGDFSTSSFTFIDNATDLGSQISFSTATNKLYFTGFTGSPTYPYICPSTSNPYCYTPGSQYNQNFPWDIFLTSLDLQGVNVGLPEVKMSDTGTLSIFPNPSTNDFTLVISTEGSEKTTILVFNTLGQQIDSFELLSGENRLVIKTESWPDGVYHIQANQGAKIYSQKVIVQH